MRPTKEECSEEDRDLLCRTDDDLEMLSNRCIEVRKLMNQSLPLHLGNYEADLRSRASQIPGAGLGLFFLPPSLTSVIREGETICYYHGHLHDFQSSKQIEDKSYLMLVDGDVLVDPRPLPEIKARYINDPINVKLLNALYEPQIKTRRSAVIAIRDIMAGEEIFAPYGDFYWSMQGYSPSILIRLRPGLCSE